MSEPKENALCIGIDLGTSNTEITVFRDGVVETLPITQNRNLSGRLTVQMKQLPSLVCFAENGTPMFGEVYRKPSSEIIDYIGRVVLNTKRMLLARPESKVYHIPNKNGTVDLYSPQDIATLLLKRCFEEVTRQKGYRPGDPVMITVPCGYHMDQVHATIRAARAAGFQVNEDRELITEPVAALIEYIRDQNDKYPETDPRHIDLSTPQNILVYDMGGGTLDLSVVRIEKRGDEEFHFRELANNNKERDRTIGGADFDFAVAQKIRTLLLEDAAKSRNCTVEDVIRDLDQTDYFNECGLMETIHNMAYTMKPSLSRGDSIPIKRINFYDMEDWNSGGRAAVVTLNGGVVDGMESICYMDLVRDFLTPGTSRNILDPIHDVLDSSILEGCKVPLSQFDKILITGGMCKFQPVRQALTDYLEKLACDPEEPIRLTVLESDAGLEAVSIGAAYSHQMTIRNHSEHLSNRYYLDVNNGLPQELVARGSCAPIRLVNPTEAIFAIYGGTGYADPDIRRQAYHHKRFNPPLSGSATVSFRLDTKKNGESVLIGTIRQDGKPDEDIEFKEDQSRAIGLDTDAPSSRNALLQQALSLPTRSGGSYGSAIPAPSKGAAYMPAFNGIYQGSAQKSAKEGDEKRLFLNSTSNHDRVVSREFAQMLYILDLEGKQNGNLNYTNLPVYTRFHMLLERIREYYQSQSGQSRYPLFQYALYSLRQLPLDMVPMPNFPARWEDSENLFNETLRQVSEGVRDFCELVGELLAKREIPEASREQLERELIYCITEWNWQDTFQVCISVAQAAALPNFADALQRRLMRRVRSRERLMPDPMEEPPISTQSRIAQIYWNAIDKGITLNPEEIAGLEMLLQGRFCTLDETWLHSVRFEKQFLKLDETTRKRMIRNNRSLPDPNQREAMSLSDVYRPRDLLNDAFRDAHFENNRGIRPAYWEKVNGFLTDEATTWDMVSVLSKRGRSYGEETKNLLVNLPAPDDRTYRGVWIRTLGCCRTEEALAKLKVLWNQCILYQKVRMIYHLNQQPKPARLNGYLDAAAAWQKSDPQAVEGMVADHSFDILMALCLCDRKNRENNMQLLSCIIASVPYGWITSPGTFGQYWNAASKAFFHLWSSMNKKERDACRQAMTSALYHRVYQSWNRYPNDLDQMNLALNNFCTFFLANASARDMYQVGLVNLLLKVFASARVKGGECPLKDYSQRKYSEFLDKWVPAQNLGSEREKYVKLLILWYESTNDWGKSLLRESPAYRKLIGTRPTNQEIDLDSILHAPLYGF